MKPCEEKLTDPKIVLVENRSKMIFLNKNRNEVIKVTVDGCKIKKGKRCDYLVINHSGKEFYVELKGNKVKKAYEQLRETILKLSQSKQELKKAFIICSRSPLASTEIQNLQKKIKEEFNCILVVRTKVHKEQI